MLTMEEFRMKPELYGATQPVQEYVLVYPHYVKYVKRETAMSYRTDLIEEIASQCREIDVIDLQHLIMILNKIDKRYGVEVE